MAEKQLAVDTFIARVRIREMLSDVAKCEGPQKSIAKGMDSNISITMAEKTESMRDFNTAYPEIAVFYETMYVVALTDTEHGCRVVGLSGCQVSDELAAALAKEIADAIHIKAESEAHGLIER